MDFAAHVDQILEQRERQLWEGITIRVDKLVSDAIRVPEGDYRVLIKDCSVCTLVPTNEANKQTFEVMRPTLNGFYNPEVHKRTVPLVSKTIVG